ncbi:MAG: PaaI family thioesterase [Acidimicrobiales bacterium]
MPTDHDRDEPTDEWAAMAEAAAALRRVNRAFAGRLASDDELRSLAAAADALAARLESGAPRSKELTMGTALGIAPGSVAPPATPVGDELEFDPLGAGGGRLHPASVGFLLVRDTETSVRCTTVVDGMFQGPPDRVHGGIVALLFDEVMSAVNRAMGTRAFTARLTLNLRAPAPVGSEITIRAWQQAVEGRKITICAEGHGIDGRFADADGLFIAWKDQGGARGG